jgi:hypothetical protein
MNLIFLIMAWLPIVIGTFGIFLISYYFYKWSKGIRVIKFRLAGEICFLLVLIYFFIFFLLGFYIQPKMFL